MFNVDRRVIGKWAKVENKIIETTRQRSTFKSFTNVQGWWPELENKLFDWFTQKQNEGGCVSGKCLQSQAKIIYEEIYKNVENVKPFEASLGWLLNYLKRKKLVCRRLTTTGREVDEITGAKADQASSVSPSQSSPSSSSPALTPLPPSPPPSSSTELLTASSSSTSSSSSPASSSSSLPLTIQEQITNHQLLQAIRDMNKLLKQQLQQQQEQGQTPPQQQNQSIPLGDIANIIATTSHLLPKNTKSTNSTSITSTTTTSNASFSTSTNKPKKGRKPFPRDENGKIIRQAATTNE